MPRVDTAAQRTELTLEERRERRRLRREKQREDNVKRASKMHVARIKIDAKTAAALPELKQSVHVGCSGWRYWKWRDSFYAGVRQNDWFGHYLKHFAAPPGAPVWIAPIMLPIELISHVSRVLSLSLRLFGNIFGEELVILILASIVPFIVPLPMMLLGLLTSTLQAAIFVMLTMIYLGGAVQSEGHGDEHEHQPHRVHVDPAVQH